MTSACTIAPRGDCPANVPVGRYTTKQMRRPSVLLRLLGIGLLLAAVGYLWVAPFEDADTPHCADGARLSTMVRSPRSAALRERAGAR